MDNELGENLKKFRIQANLSKGALGRKARISPATVGRIESGFTPNPDTETLHAIAKVLKIPVGVLLPAGDIHDLPQAHITKPVPLLGSIPAGSPEDCPETLGTVEVLAHQAGKGRYVLRVYGESMSPRIEPNDLILVEYRDHIPIETGADRVCTVILNRESTLKYVRWNRRRGPSCKVWLEGANDGFTSIEIKPEDDFRITGIVLEIVSRRL
jgi:transcriptional regulator with XRE-family HTH domain